MDNEKIIFYLTAKKGVSLQQIARDLNVERGKLASWRTSKKESRQKELGNALAKAYGHMINQEKIIETEREINEIEENTDQVKTKYIALLEESIKEVREERDRLRIQVKQLIDSFGPNN